MYKGTCRGCKVAIKTPKPPKGKTEFDTSTLDNFKREVTVMSNLFHPNICLFMGAFVSPNSIKIGFFFF